MRIRTYLRSIRERQGLSLAQAAEQTGIAKGELSEIERGRQIPRDDQVLPLLHVYGQPGGWYPPTVRDALADDAVCERCRKPLEPGSVDVDAESCAMMAARTGQLVFPGAVS